MVVEQLAQPPATCPCAIWAVRVEVTRASPCVQLGGPWHWGAGDKPCVVHHPDLTHRDVSPQESSSGHTCDPVPNVPSQPGGPGGAVLGTLCPHLSWCQTLLSTAAAVCWIHPAFHCLISTNCQDPPSWGGGFSPLIRTHSAGPTASPGAGLGAFCSPFQSRQFNFGHNLFQHRARLPARLSAEISHP